MLVVDPEAERRREVPPPASGTRVTASGEIEITIAPNPSHLEAVDPVVEGWTRAEQTDRSSGAGLHDPSVAVPVLIHGDAAFPGQGSRRPSTCRASRASARRHAARDHEQPGRVHDEPDREPLDLLLERPREGLRHPDRARQCRRSRGRPSAVRWHWPSRGVRPRLPGRSGRLSALRAQRAGRGGVHAAAHGRPHPCPADGPERYAAWLVAEGVLPAEDADQIVEEVVAALRAAHERPRATIAEPPAPPSEPLRRSAPAR